MSIDPNDITTKQVSELPPAPLSPTSLFPHQVGDILSSATIDELLLYVRSQSISQPYETKILTLPEATANTYINANFDMSVGGTQGIGKVDGLWNGWAIHNGNNGTINMDGLTMIGYGANYNTIGEQVGSETKTLVVNNLPSHTHSVTLKGSVNTSGGTGANVVNNVTNNGSDVVATSSSVGSSTPINIMQPSIVVLMIMKLP